MRYRRIVGLASAVIGLFAAFTVAAPAASAEQISCSGTNPHRVGLVVGYGYGYICFGPGHNVVDEEGLYVVHAESGVSATYTYGDSAGNCPHTDSIQPGQTKTYSAYICALDVTVVG